MATILKSTIRRFNGTDWDSIYLGTSADIVGLGKASTIEKLETKPFGFGTVLEAGDNVSDLLISLINRVATIDHEVLPKLEDGSGVTEVEASKITGVIDRSNLPDDVGGKVVDAASLDAVDKASVHIGDIVQIKDSEGNVVSTHVVKNVTAGAAEGDPPTVEFAALTDAASDVKWDRIVNTPTTLAGYGITDAVGSASIVDHGAKNAGDAEDWTAAGKITQTNADGKLDFDITGDAGSVGGKKLADLALKTDIDAINDTIGDADTDGTIKKDIATLQNDLKNSDASWIKTGILDVAVVPKAALSEMHVITSEADLAGLTTTQVQKGDTVKIADETDGEGNITKAGMMYYVVDETKLGTSDWKDAYLPYTAGEASAVAWSGVTNKPTTLVGYGITDAVDSTTFDEHKTAIDQILNGKPADPDTGTAAVAGLVEKVTNIQTTLGDADTADTVLGDIAALKGGSGITELDVSKLKGIISKDNLSSDITKAVTKETTDAPSTWVTNTMVNPGDVVIEYDPANAGQVHGVWIVTKTDPDTPDGAVTEYATVYLKTGKYVDWSSIDNTPTTLAGYGITDAIGGDLLTDDGIPSDSNTDVAGKIVKIADDEKLHVNIAGDATSVGGKTLAELDSTYVDQTTFNELALRVPLIVNSLSDVTDPQVGQLVLVPVETTETPVG